MRPIKTLVLLANDGQARLFENLGIGKGLSEIEDLAASMLRGDAALYADRPGRNAATPGVAQHGFDRSQSEHDQAQAAFAKAVLDEVGDRFRDGGYDRFVMAAAPGMLGVLRAGLPPELKANLAADVDKDLLKLKPADVVTHLADTIVL